MSAVLRFEIQDHDGVHLNEATVGIVRKAGVAGLLRQCRDGSVIEAEIENGVHHSRHRELRAGTHGYEQRSFRIAKAAPGHRLELEHGFGNVVAEFLGKFSFGEIFSAQLGGNRKPRRNRKPEPGHFVEVGTFTAKYVFHPGGAVRPSIPKEENVLHD